MTLLTNRRKAEKSKTMWQLTSTTLNNQPKRKIKKEIKKKNLKTNENRITAHIKIYRVLQKQFFGRNL